ncbi:MAG: hypothetical protein AAGN82_21855, partial [Myxococcota bacterium]
MADGDLTASHVAAPEGEGFWAPLGAWTSLGLQVRAPLAAPTSAAPASRDLIPERGGATGAEALPIGSASVHEQLRWWRGDREGNVDGPWSTAELGGMLDEADDEVQARGGDAWVALAGSEVWHPVRDVVALSDGRALASSEVPGGVCDVCLERIPADSDRCPECGERMTASSTMRPASLAPSLPGDPDGQPVLRQHWRPLLTGLALTALLTSGVVLRHVAPDRYEPPREDLAPAAPAEPRCKTPCWRGEACQVGQCVWAPSNDVGHIEPASLAVSGPFSLPAEASDVLPLDNHRFAVASLRGVHILNADDGAAISLVSDAPHTRRLHRVGDVVYATAPRRIYVIDAGSAEVRKTLELGHAVSHLARGASGQRVLASMPSGKAVAVIATDYH